MIRSSHIRLCLAAMLLWILPALEARSQDWEAFEEPENLIPCRLSLHIPGEVEWRGPRSRGYEPESAAVHRERVGFEVRNAGGSCAYEVEIAPADGAPRMIGRQGALRYILKVENAEQATDQLSLHSRFHGSGGVSSHGFMVEMPAAQYVPAGTYGSDLDITLLTQQSGVLRIEDTRRVRIGADVWPRVHVSVGERADGGISSRQVNLGRLKSGMERNLDFSVYANSGYRINLESENEMRLKHEKASIYVPYSLMLDGEPITQSRLVDMNTVSQGSIGRLHDFRIIIGRVDNGQAAGHYSDRLLVTVISDQ